MVKLSVVSFQYELILVDRIVYLYIMQYFFVLQQTKCYLTNQTTQIQLKLSSD